MTCRSSLREGWHLDLRPLEPSTEGPSPFMEPTERFQEDDAVGDPFNTLTVSGSAGSIFPVFFSS